MASGWRILDLTETSGSFDVERGAVVITMAVAIGLVTGPVAT
jgi:hypothetical protein